MSGRTAKALTAAQRRRRQEAAVKLRLQGYTVEEIGRALGCALSTISGVLAEAGMKAEDAPSSINLPLPELTPISWRTQAHGSSFEDRRRRREISVKLHRKGYTGHAIAAALGVNPSTVSSDLANAGIDGTATHRPQRPPPEPIDWRSEFPISTAVAQGEPPPQVQDSRGRARLAIKSSPGQIDRRREAAAKLYRDGYSAHAIAAALKVGTTTVHIDLNAEGITPDRRKRIDEPPATIDWWSEPKPEVASHLVAPLYQRSNVVDTWKSVLDWSREGRGVCHFANDARDAVAAKDKAWLESQLELFRGITDYIHRLEACIQDPDFRERAIHNLEDGAALKQPHLRVQRSS